MNRSYRTILCIALAVAVLGTVGASGATVVKPRPNIVFIMTDDQGYGDLAFTGNPVAKTPHLDHLAAESSRLTGFHVAPTCAPTRAALLTGRWNNRTGVWHTVNGRSMLREDEVTLARMLKEQGYSTGLFGKWHLGDNYPYRPEDRGFDEVYRHGAGGIGQTPDFWDNAYFDGHYLHNGKRVAAQGFCTDVFFQQTEKFIRANAEAGTPFFAYVVPNAPHVPLHAPQEYIDLYPDQERGVAAFYAMISNIDDNVGRLRQLLSELGLTENTLFIFTTDNGTATGQDVFNAGMRGKKGSEYDGGHRVPFVAHWPAAGWNQAHASDVVAHAIDLVPTILEVAGISRPAGVELDGVSLRSLLDPSSRAVDWPERYLVVDSQRVRDPIKWKQTAVLSQEWRLVNGTELYAIKSDPGQRRNVAADHPGQVARMRAFYDKWWEELLPSFDRTTEIYLGAPEAPVVVLTAHDWIQEELPPWNQRHIRGGHTRTREDVPLRHEGYWAVKVVRAGSYAFELRRWPEELDRPINAALPPAANVSGADAAYRTMPGAALPVVEASLRIAGESVQTLPVSSSDSKVTFLADLAPGSYRLSPVFRTDGGDEIGAYYTSVRRTSDGDRSAGSKGEVSR